MRSISLELARYGMHWIGDKQLQQVLARWTIAFSRSLKVRRLVEWTRNDAFTLELRTDIVSFPRANTAGRNTALLIYSIVYKKDGKDRARPRLITVFPVDSGFANNLFKAEGLGERVPFKLKYNASVQGDLNPALLVGRRFIVE